MAPYNLENNIREKLENRELKPSPDAWKKLESQLKETQPKKKSWSWYYLAASLVGVLIATTVFLNRNEPNFKKQIVTETIQENHPFENNDEVVSNSIQSIKDEKTSEGDKTGKETHQNSNEIKPTPSQNESAVDKKIKRSDVLASVGNKEREIKTEESVPNENRNQDEIFNAKVEEVVASVKSLQHRNAEVTAEEVENLLTNARRDIQAQTILTNSKIDAAALLNEVEWELEKSFRDKVFDALGEGFNKIRTAVLERND